MPARLQSLLDIFVPSSAGSWPRDVRTAKDSLPRPKVSNLCGVPPNTRLVAFSTVTVREYGITADAGGADESSFPITLSWNFHKRRPAPCPPAVVIQDSAPHPDRRVLFANKYAPPHTRSLFSSESTRSSLSSSSTSCMSTIVCTNHNDDDVDRDSEHDNEDNGSLRGDDDDDNDDNDDDSVSLDQDGAHRLDYTYRMTVDDHERLPKRLPRMWTASERRQLLRSVGGWTRQALLQYERARRIEMALEYHAKTSKSSRKTKKKDIDKGECARVAFNKYLI